MIKLTQLIKELSINKPVQIIPTNFNRGQVLVNNKHIEYSNESDGYDLELIYTDGIYEEYVNLHDEDEDYYPEEESLQACNDYLRIFITYFGGNNVQIKEDSYGVSYISINKEAFEKRMPSTSLVKPLGNGKFKYKDKVLILRELNPKELENYKIEYVKDQHMRYPHMNYDKNPEEALQYSELKDDNKVYYIFKSNGEHLPNRHGFERDEIFSIDKNSDINNINNLLNLIPYFLHI